MPGITDLDELLATLRPSIRRGEFVFVAGGDIVEPEAMVREREGRGFVVERAVADAQGLAYDAVFAWITLEVYSSVQAVGLTAAVATALAGESIACNVLAGFHHDHLLVPLDRADDAMAALHRLSSGGCRGSS